MKKINIIGVPIDLGADRRGVDMGPSAIRYAGLQAALQELGWEVSDAGNISVPVAESVAVQNSKAKYVSEIARVSEKLAAITAETIEAGAIPIVLGGDHSVAIGAIAGVAKARRPLGLIWFDTHGDMNTPETTPSGNIHGMSLATSLGLGHPDLVNCAGFAPKVEAAHTVLIGVRDLDQLEKNTIRQSGITVFTMNHIDRLGMETVMRQAIAIASRGTAGIHVSFDLDVVDPAEAPGVGTAKSGGITYREAHLAMELLAETGLVISLDFSEVNPILDVHNRTGVLAVELISSLLGKRII